jgi:hypothetical protein
MAYGVQPRTILEYPNSQTRTKNRLSASLKNWAPVIPKEKAVVERRSEALSRALLSHVKLAASSGPTFEFVARPAPDARIADPAPIKALMSRTNSPRDYVLRRERDRPDRSKACTRSPRAVAAECIRTVLLLLRGRTGVPPDRIAPHRRRSHLRCSKTMRTTLWRTYLSSHAPLFLHKREGASQLS